MTHDHRHAIIDTVYHWAQLGCKDRIEEAVGAAHASQEAKHRTPKPHPSMCAQGNLFLSILVDV